ncbi:hypothetical protein HQQ80_07345 [Microbacteriaceae bacterium VKM Ac-2855]|nr:hypothetical protein [Microbacteriaceae bacterium VKM Ac-2855]
MIPLESTPAAAPRIRIPSRPEPGRRPGFPLLASVTPVLAAGVIWAITKSPYVLAFAALGPVIAIAGYLDGLRTRRRDARRAEGAYNEARRVLAERIDVEHGRERRAAFGSTPDTALILSGSAEADTRWRSQPSTATLVLGHGPIPSRLQVDGDDVDPLAVAARTLHDAPITAPLAGGIGVHGEAPLVRAYLRGLIVQAAHAIAPGSIRIDGPADGEWSWSRRLPHRGDAVVRVVDGFTETSVESAGAVAVLAMARSAEELPSACACIVRIDTARRAVVLGRRRRGAWEEIVPSFASETEASLFALDAAASAPAAEDSLPGAVSLRSMLSSRRGPHVTGLPAAIGVDTNGPIVVDLVADGPHAIVGGTTGSGKSELLTTWVLALAAAFSPARVNFLLADFKGGATFAGLESLPHCVGTITDLDPIEADRAFESLSAELRRRERILAEMGAKDVSTAGADAPARLVVMVDECAFLLDQAPQLHRLFADIAARGRSLGVHLVLCTQRPAGVVRDAVAANCGLRMSLRVHDVGDSRLVVGTDAAARLPHDRPGRLIVARGGRQTLVQTALATPNDLDAVISDTDRRISVHRPWLDPLPARIELPEASRSGALCDALLGVVDRPQLQSQDVLRLGSGHLLVIGAGGTGKSSALEILRAQVPTDLIRCSAAEPEGAWDAVTRGMPTGSVLLIDDLDLLLRRYPAEMQRLFLEALATLLRSASETGLAVVATAQRLGDGLSALMPLFGRCLALRLSSRQEHQLLGVDAPFEARLPPGAGWWGGERLQLFAPARIDRADAAPSRTARRKLSSIDRGSGPLAIVSSRPRVTRDLVRSVGWTPSELPTIRGALPPDATEVLLGSVEDWQMHRSAFERIRLDGVLLLDALSSAEIRVLLGPRVTAPYCAGPTLLLLHDGELERLDAA